MDKFTIAPTPSELIEAVNECIEKVGALPEASTTEAGLMTAEDKQALNTLLTTTKSLAEQLTTVANSLASVSARVNAAEASIGTNTSNTSSINDRVGSLERRVSSLENRYNSYD